MEISQSPLINRCQGPFRPKTALAHELGRNRKPQAFAFRSSTVSVQMDALKSALHNCYFQGAIVLLWKQTSL